MNSKHKITRILFASIFVLLFIPLLQMQFRVFPVNPLNGTIKKIQKSELTASGWFSEKFQSQTEKYLNQNFGFRNWFVRLNNQFKFSFFNKAQANGVIVGIQNFLYEESYIDAYYGRDFLGKDTIRLQMQKLRTIQDSLKKHNTDILLVFAPGKASFYPEYIPNKYDNLVDITNHQYSVEQAKKYGINHIDFSTWFINNKEISNYCLYPKTGIHWSYYGMNFAADSISRYIEHLKQIDMPDLIWDTIETSKKLRGVDNDIEKGMNLLCSISNFAMPYPKITVAEENKTKPKAIVIADSFYWQMHNAGYSGKLFDHGEFWFYFKKIYPPRKDKDIQAGDLNLLEELYQRDLVILMCTEPILKRRFWGFVDECYNDILLDAQSLKGIEIQSIISKILSNEEWTEGIKKKAEEKNIDFETMLQMDAKYIYNQKIKNN